MINHPDAVSNIAVPTFETKVAVHITVNARCPNGPHRERARSAPRRWSDLRPSGSPGAASERPGSDLSINPGTPAILHSPDRRWNVRQRRALQERFGSHSGCAEPPDGTVHYRDKWAGVSLRARRLKAKRFASTFPGWTGQAAAAKPMPVAPPTIQRHFPWRSSIVPDCLCVDNGLGKARNQWRRTIGENRGLGCSRQPRAWDPRCRSVLRFTSFPAELPWGRLGGALDI